MKRNLFIIAISAICFLAMEASCRRPSRISLLEHYRGNALITAINNGDEHLLEYMPELRGTIAQYANTPEKIAAVKKFAVAMVKKIEADDPQFYNDFSSKVSSGDTDKAEKALEEGLSRIAAEVKAYSAGAGEEALFEKIMNEYKEM